MAHFLDEEAEQEFIDISLTSDSQQGPQAGAIGGAGLPSPPHQPPLKVNVTIKKMARLWFSAPLRQILTRISFLGSH